MSDDWPFSDPENAPSMTVRGIIEANVPILYVVRDDDDGMFQFLTGDELREEDAMVVCLRDMLEHDPSLRGVADLPAGASATRETAEGQWQWHLPGQEEMSLGPRVEADGDWSEAQYDEWLGRVTESLEAKQSVLGDVYQLGSFSRYDYDLGEATLTFSDDGVAKLRASLQVVGSVSKLTGTWLWSWDNSSLPDPAKERLQEVLAFGEAHGLRELTVGKWSADEANGWAMTAAAAELLDATGAYRAPGENVSLFLVLFDPQTL